ncbi:class I SAM-dependent methyltransferase [Colwellia ponticola]|uniref:Class I SAM-dependent methyltransferase n=1 Tax=Colwellia ponticola TaxID=2304625 RepID=A0A8H2JML9_9GAMM|nr:class I SAM-dependent methyltransferase [Colwellia ponticola]TMM46412.1 class I SAM-dependent methyltransferase [Colwellia ponticola]
MKPPLTLQQPHYPKSWQALPNGDVIKTAIEQELAPWWQKFFGYHLVKLGALSSEVDIPDCTIKHQINISSKSDLTNIEANIDHLPLQKHSVDVCLLSHTLEFALDPHHVVREANRVLIPNGYLVITGFNPLSLVGVNRLLPYRRNKTPWNEHFFSPMRVKDWLHLMGYEILADQRCLHSCLTGKLTTESLQQKWHRFAKRYFPSLGSVYVIVAKKRVLPLTPIKPKWQIQSAFQPVKVASMNTPKNQPKVTKR